jgi:hypothetical protein
MEAKDVAPLPAAATAAGGPPAQPVPAPVAQAKPAPAPQPVTSMPPPASMPPHAQAQPPPTSMPQHAHSHAPPPHSHAQPPPPHTHKQPPQPLTFAHHPHPHHQHQHQQQPAPGSGTPPAPMPGSGMRLSFDQMVAKPPGEQHHQQHQHPHQHHGPGPMLYNAPQPYATVPPPGANALGMGELMRKKRGRPRKYAPDGSMALALAPLSSASGGAPPPPPGQQQQQHGFSISSPPSDPNAKRRGRPPGSGKKKQFEALGNATLPLPLLIHFSLHKSDLRRLPFPAGSWGISFTPHILSVKAGEVATDTMHVHEIPQILHLIFFSFDYIPCLCMHASVQFNVASIMLLYWSTQVLLYLH